MKIFTASESDRNKSPGKSCAEGECIAGLIGTKPIPETEWESAVTSFEAIIKNWNERTRRHAVPHPGFIHPARYCIECGRKLKP